MEILKSVDPESPVDTSCGIDALMNPEETADHKLDVPQFDSKGMVPEELADEWEKLPKSTKAIIRRLMVSEHKFDWVIERLCSGHTAIKQLQDDVSVLNKIKEVVFAKWSVVVLLMTILVVPATLVWFGNHLAAQSDRKDMRNLETILERILEREHGPKL